MAHVCAFSISSRRKAAKRKRFLLNREGDCALLPLSDVISRSDGQEWQRSHNHAIVAQALADLERDGWELFGRITIIKERRN